MKHIRKLALNPRPGNDLAYIHTHAHAQTGSSLDSSGIKEDSVTPSNLVVDFYAIFPNWDSTAPASYREFITKWLAG
jgi:hypothetical protein